MKDERRIDALVAFLGAPPNGYGRAVYEWEGREYETRYSPEAIAYFFRPKRLLVMVTPTARVARTAHEESGEVKNNLEDLMERTAVFGCQTLPIDIPETVGEATTWELFNACFKAIERDERIIFDFTYGFRFIPLLVVLAGQFLQVAKGVSVSGIYYGAFEGKDEHGRTPIIDLSTFSDLMIWTQAAAHFVKTGNARPLVEAMSDVRNPLLTLIRENLRATSQGLRLGIAPQVGQSVSDLLALLTDDPFTSQQQATLLQATPVPLRALYHTIAAKYAPLALEESLRPDDTPLDQENAPYHLRQQARLLEWYVRHDHFLQAWLLAREWLVTWVAMDMELHGLGIKKQLKATRDVLLLSTVREKAEALLNAYPQACRRKPTREEQKRRRFAEEQLQVVRGWTEIVQLWSDCTEVRNQVAHMSMRPDPSSVVEVRGKLKRINEAVKQLVTTLPAPPSLTDGFEFWNVQ